MIRALRRIKHIAAAAITLPFYAFFSFITRLDGDFGSFARYGYYKLRLKKCGGYFISNSGFRIDRPQNVSIGKGCSFNYGVLIIASKSIEIGDNVIIGPYTVLRDSNHRYNNPEIPISSQGHSKGEIRLLDDVWIGGHAVVLKDVTVGPHSVIAAQSLINKDVPQWEVWGGVPAKYLKVREARPKDATARGQETGK